MKPEGNRAEKELLEIAATLLRTTTDQLTLEAGVGDVPGWDSFAQVNLLMKIEEHFQIAFDTEDLLTMQSLGDMLVVVRRLTEANAPRASSE